MTRKPILLWLLAIGIRVVSDLARFWRNLDVFGHRSTVADLLMAGRALLLVFHLWRLHLDLCLREDWLIQFVEFESAERHHTFAAFETFENLHTIPIANARFDLLARRVQIGRASCRA